MLLNCPHLVSSYCNHENVGKMVGKSTWRLRILICVGPTSMPYLSKYPVVPCIFKIISKKQQAHSIFNPLRKDILNDHNILLPVT